MSQGHYSYRNLPGLSSSLFIKIRNTRKESFLINFSLLLKGCPEWSPARGAVYLVVHQARIRLRIALLPCITNTIMLFDGLSQAELPKREHRFSGEHLLGQRRPAMPLSSRSSMPERPVLRGRTGSRASID